MFPRVFEKRKSTYRNAVAVREGEHREHLVHPLPVADRRIHRSPHREDGEHGLPAFSQKAKRRDSRRDVRRQRRFAFLDQASKVSSSSLRFLVTYINQCPEEPRDRASSFELSIVFSLETRLRHTLSKFSSRTFFDRYSRWGRVSTSTARTPPHSNARLLSESTVLYARPRDTSRGIVSFPPTRARQRKRRRFKTEPSSAPFCLLLARVGAVGARWRSAQRKCSSSTPPTVSRSRSFWISTRSSADA